MRQQQSTFIRGTPIMLIVTAGRGSVAANFALTAPNASGAFHQLVMMMASRPARAGMSVHRARPMGFEVRQTTGRAPWRTTSALKQSS